MNFGITGILVVLLLIIVALFLVGLIRGIRSGNNGD
jgi:hypothetical protein